MKPGGKIIRLLLPMLAVTLCGGCANSKSAGAAKSPGKLFAVTAQSTPFYYRGPAQGGGPDKTIPKDTLLKMIRTSFGFCKVQLLTGEEGYVANEDIAAASPALIAATNAPARITAATSGRADSPEPDFNVPTAPLPEFEPTPIPSPPNSSN
jgi:hypothetical protein